MKPLTLIAPLALLAALGAVFYFGEYQKDGKGISTEPSVSESEEEVSPHHTAMSSRWFVAGDTFWARRIQQAADASPEGVSFPFSRLNEFGLQEFDNSLNPAEYSFDYSITNLECPVTDEVVPLQEQEEILKFNCRTDFLPEFARYFDLVSLANNHTDNVNTEEGLQETRLNLEQNGIAHFGHYDNAVTDELCSVQFVPFNYLPYDRPRETGGLTLPIAFCGFHGVFKQPTDEEIAVISEYSDDFFTVVMPHMGAEYEPAADNIKTTSYRKMVDAGADIVIGGHPHWVQNTEIYNGVPIIYSLGNFLFDQEWSTDVKRGAALEIDLTIPASPQLDRYTDLAYACLRSQDPDCNITQAYQDAQDLEVPEIKLDIRPVFSEYADGQVFPASEQTSKELLERMNWTETSTALSELNERP